MRIERCNVGQSVGGIVRESGMVSVGVGAGGEVVGGGVGEGGDGIG